jgi:hypothetical protein
MNSFDNPRTGTLLSHDVSQAIRSILGRFFAGISGEEKQHASGFFATTSISKFSFMLGYPYHILNQKNERMTISSLFLAALKENEQIEFE